MTPLVKETELQEVLTVAHHDYQKGLNARAFFKVHNKATSEDLVQETFMKTWSYLVRGGKIDIMRAFLYHVLNNLIVDEYRKRKTISLDALVEKGFEPSDSKSERLINVLDGRAMLLLVQRLPAKPIRYAHALCPGTFTYRNVSHYRSIKKYSCCTSYIAD
jgi:DNA-directed RNA polymerase specialized sigma24 family protein